ncbi:hypothetical protein G7Z17_g7349 [Cylindrodendrum hubeiense]|uniref:Uncharacterized protein n=1 Tax=Cylindrodendrum hubeiense TaxID=595255 RepID=A0A9P5H840_9HYPO|nr:hypothetical protein G7Z17_g7349 [Cylindrodendrum hubeiense]
MASPREKLDYSTLELDLNVHGSHRFVENQPQHPPEVNRNATTDLDYPELAHPDMAHPKPEAAHADTGDKSRICGLRRKIFFAILLAAIIVVAAIVAGVAVAVTKKSNDKSSDDSSSDTSGDSSSKPAGESKGDGTAILTDTDMAAANFTDEFGYDNYLVVYQLQNLAIYMSAYNSSEDKWIVSPVVDGTNGISLDTVRNGTDLALDVYYHNATWRDVHLYWQSPTNAVKTLFRNSMPTTETSSPKDWTYPFSTDRYSGAEGSSIVSYGRQCVYCTLYTYIFFQDDTNDVSGGVLFHDNEDGWTDRNFTDITTPATDTPLALAVVAATNVSDRGMSIFYQTESGVLAQITYDGDSGYSGQTLSRGLVDNSTIVAFSTGFNDTESGSSGLGYQVLTTDPDSDGVLLTYYHDGAWAAGNEVTALSSCASRSTMAVNFGRRVYCVVDGDNGEAEIVEWRWRGEPNGDTDSFTSYDKVGTLSRDSTYGLLGGELSAALEAAASPILAKEGIAPISLELVMREIDGVAGTADPTMFIVATWLPQSDQAWQAAVIGLKQSADQLLAAAGQEITLYVEIIDESLIKSIFIGVVPHIPRLVDDWPTLKVKIQHCLDNFPSTRSHMTAISLLRFGPSWDIDSNPITVYISVGYLSDETEWSAVIHRIESDLAMSGWPDLRVHLEHNVIQRYGFDLITTPDAHDKEFGRIIKESYQKVVDLGADLGAARYITRDDEKLCNPPLGTLGCYIEVNTKTNPTWKKYALTNYHVVRACFNGFAMVKKDKETALTAPGTETRLFNTDHQGFWPKRDTLVYDMESPSRVKHNYTVSILTNICTRLARPRKNKNPELDASTIKFKKDKEEKVTFFDEGHNLLGNLWIASGFNRRTSANSRLDWALIDVNPARQGQNRLPSFHVWFDRYVNTINWPSVDTFGQQLQSQSSVSFKTMAARTKVFKVGSSTGNSSGYSHEYKTDCTLSHDKYIKRGVSSEFAVIGARANRATEQRFADRGDSGAVVFDEEGNVVGLLFGGQQPQGNDTGYGLVTPIEDVFQDIKDRSKDDITHIRILDSPNLT